jgi:hypothetical protein
MKLLILPLLALVSITAASQMAMDHQMPNMTPGATEKLGTVNFSVSCKTDVQAHFNRGVAFLHDFWYEEAERQFKEIAKSDPDCAMAHWGIAMSAFHQIWGRPGEKAMAMGADEIKKAQVLKATEREGAYIGALSLFYNPGKQEFPARVQAYSDAMAALYGKYPDDVDAGAFYALSLLAAKPAGDASVNQEQKAMAVLAPLIAKYPDNPGLVHYVIHSCDNPTMAAEALQASDHYGEIASSGAHAYHMPGHIYARLGMWPQDIEANLGSVTAAKAAQANFGSGLMDEPHAYDFLMYAYLQSGQDERSRWVLEEVAGVLNELDTMKGMPGHRMESMVPYYRAKFPVLYNLEMRDWKSAGALEPPAGAPPEVETLTVWARAIAHGHLHQAAEAKADLARYNKLTEEIKKGKYAYLLQDTATSIEGEEVEGWVAFANSDQEKALKSMRAAADLQDKVGQGEVDIPAREMLADMLLESNRPQQALTEYEVALKLSPNRFNGLYHAGMAAEASGDKQKATSYYVALLKSTQNGANSTRSELLHAKAFVANAQLAKK